MYIYEMPAVERQCLCAILDDNNIWSELAVTHMGYDKSIIQEIKRAMNSGNSPSEELISNWGELNHTVTELFVLLSKIQQYTAMEAIKSLVDNKYHRLIMVGQPDLSALLNKQSITSSNTEKKNLDARRQKTEKILNCEPQVLSNENNESTKPGDSDVKNVNIYASTIPEINYNELAEATNNWSKYNILGHGGFGVVFKGMYKYTAVAIKRIEFRGSGTAENIKIQIQQSVNEIRYLNSCRHDNILPLYGYSSNGEAPCLVYQLMAGGSLEEKLSIRNKQTPLNWRQRLNIAQGTARGLQYLHTFKETPLIHGDIKPANILLDPCCQPKIGDFGLAREGLNSAMEVSRVYGTKPYLPMEFLSYRSLSTKVDTYSFGVVLFELVTGLRAHDKTRKHQFLTKHVCHSFESKATIEDLMDKSYPDDPNASAIAENLIKLGGVCTADKPNHRPEMVMVLKHLEAVGTVDKHNNLRPEMVMVLKRLEL